METMEYELARNMTLLFFLERLLDKGEPRTLHDLSCQFGAKGFTKEMRQIAGGSQSGKFFFISYLIIISTFFVCVSYFKIGFGVFIIINHFVLNISILNRIYNYIQVTKKCLKINFTHKKKIEK